MQGVKFLVIKAPITTWFVEEFNSKNSRLFKTELKNGNYMYRCIYAVKKLKRLADSLATPPDNSMTSGIRGTTRKQTHSYNTIRAWSNKTTFIVSKFVDHWRLGALKPSTISEPRRQ